MNQEMKLDFYQVDAFATEVFEGNPAAICPLTSWIPDELMQKIAMENNLSETAFFVRQKKRYKLRWFTPETEVDLCGHATLAAAHIVFDRLGYDSNTIYFETRSGELTVEKGNGNGLLKMNFPVNIPEETTLPAKIEQALGVEPVEAYKGMDYLFILKNEQQIRALDPEFSLLKKLNTRGFIVSAPGDDVDFVSRFFAPAVGINEDPVTGSAHTALTPYWAGKLGKKKMIARQLSKRGGEVLCRLNKDRVELSGRAQTYMTGIIELPD